MHANLGIDIKNLATLYREQERFDEALQNFQRAL